MEEAVAVMLSDAVDVQLASNPFEDGRVHSYAFEGETIEQILEARSLRIDSAYGVVVAVGGEIVPERMFSKVRPKAGALVVVKVIPRGGKSGKGILSIVIGVLAIAASIATVGAAGGFAELTAAEAFGAASLAVSGGMSIAAGIQSLLAPAPSVPFSGTIPQSGDSPALSGARNSARLYGPIRTVLGQYRVYPDLLGKPFQERVGKDSVLRLLMCFGYGPLDVTDIRIGEKPIDELIDSSKYNVLQGWDDDPELSIFRDEVDADSSIQPKFNRVAPDVAVLTTGEGPKEVSIDLAFPAGLIAFDDDGKPQTVTVRFLIEQREQGVGSFSAIENPTAGLESSTGFRRVSAGTFDLKLKQRGSITRGLRWPVPSGSTENARHEIRITRVSTTSPDWNGKSVSINADAVATVIRTIKPHVGSLIPNLAKIELEINASDTGLSGVIDNLSALCTSIVPKFDTTTQSWGPVTASSSAYNASMFPTRNPAWLFAHTLRGPANSRPVEDSRIDGPGLAVWAGNLGDTGAYPIGGYEEDGTTKAARNIDAVIDFTTTAKKVVSDIAAGGRAALNVIDGKYSVVQDIPQTQVVQHFTPRNSNGFSGSKAFRKAPHAVRVHFVNPEPSADNKSYQKDELVVYNDNFSESGNYVVRLGFRGSMTPTSLNESSAGTSSAWLSSGSTTAGHQGYSIRHTVSSTDPQLYSDTDNLMGIDTSLYKFVRVRMRRVTKGDEDWHGQIWFATGTSSFSSLNVQLQSTEPDWSKGWVTVVWDMTSNSQWTGTMDRLRFDFTQNGSSFGSVFEIESISVDDNTQAATEFAEISLWGVSNARQAYRDGRYHLASTKLRPEIFTINSDVEHLVCNRGDLVRVSHDVIGVGYGAARFTAVTNFASQFTGGVLDEEFYYDPTKDYAIRVRGVTYADSSESAEAVINVVNQGGYSSTVTPVSNYYWLSAGTVYPGIGDLVIFGERDTESIQCVVKKISPRNDLTAVIELVEYNSAVYEEGAIPEHDSNITLESSPTLLRPVRPDIIGELVSDESVALFSSSGTPEIRIVLNVSTPQNTEGTYAPTTHYHSQFRVKDGADAVTDWVNAARVEATGETEVSISPVEQGEVYDVRVRAISDPTATASDWVYRVNHTVVGLSTPPDPPTDLSVWGDAIRWEYGDKPRDFAGFIVKHQSGDDSTWATGIPLSSNLVTDNWVQIGGRIQPGTTTIMVRAVDIAGNESTTLSEVKVIRTPEQLDDISTETWTGVWGSEFGGNRIGCTLDAGTGYLVANTDSSGAFWSGGDTATFWTTDSADFWGETIYSEMQFSDDIAVMHDFADVRTPNSWPVDDDFPCRMRVANLNFEGSAIEIHYRTYSAYSELGYTYMMDDWAPWPGERILEEPEWPSAIGAATQELIRIRFTIASGKTQGKMKAAEFKVEGLRKHHREIVGVASTGGTTVDLTGKGFRKITSITVNPATTSASSQSAMAGEAYDLLANHQPDGAGTTYELSGPTIKLFDSSGTETTGSASVSIEGY
jgi:predicted phage tail protein